MILLVLLAVLLVVLTVWWLMRGLHRPLHDDEHQARLAQYALQRDRLLNELERLETAMQAGDIDAQTAGIETGRLEVELATILRQLETSGSDTHASERLPRHVSLVTTIVLSLLLPLIAGVAYLAIQGEELLWLAGYSKQDDTGLPPNHPLVTDGASTSSVTAEAQQFPPQVMEMVQRLERRLQENPDDGEGWKRLGRSYMVLGRNRDAVGAYSQAAELLPDDKDVIQALQQLAALASADKHPQQAGDDRQVAHPPMPEGSLERVVGYEKRATAEPQNALAWADLAFAYEQIGRVEDAERTWAKAYELAPDNVDILAAYAGIVFSNNPRDPGGKALSLYRKLHDLNPRHPDSLWFLGLAAYSEGNIARARELWRELLTVLPPQSEAHASVSEALANIEQILNTPK